MSASVVGFIGILARRNDKLAVRPGFQILTNHAASALPEIVRAVSGQIDVLVNGGIRYGAAPMS